GTSDGCDCRVGRGGRGAECSAGVAGEWPSQLKSPRLECYRSEPAVRNTCPILAKFRKLEVAIMGLYDNVRCKYPLPDPEAQDLEYQTKSTFAPYLENYIITLDGRLLKEQSQLRREPESDSATETRANHLSDRWVEVDFRGELEIYTIVSQPDGSHC